FFVIFQFDQANTLGVAALHGDFRHPGSHQRATIGNQHDLVAVGNLNSPDHGAVALTDLHADHSLAATAIEREVLIVGALAVAVLTDRQDLFALLRNDQGDDRVLLRQTDAPHAARRTTHLADISLVEADHLAAAAAQHDVA